MNFLLVFVFILRSFSSFGFYRGETAGGKANVYSCFLSFRRAEISFSCAMMGIYSPVLFFIHLMEHFCGFSSFVAVQFWRPALVTGCNAFVLFLTVSLC